MRTRARRTPLHRRQAGMSRQARIQARERAECRQRLRKEARDRVLIAEIEQREEDSVRIFRRERPRRARRRLLRSRQTLPRRGELLEARSWEILARELLESQEELWPEAAEQLQRIARRAPTLFAPSDILPGSRASVRGAAVSGELGVSGESGDSMLPGGARVGDPFLRIVLREWACGGWRRPLTDWKPWGRTPGRLGVSLVEHLCWARPLAPAMARAYFRDPSLWGRVARDLARGISLREAVAATGHLDGIPRKVWASFGDAVARGRATMPLTETLLHRWFWSLGIRDRRAVRLARLFRGHLEAGAPVERWGAAFAWLARVGRAFPHRRDFRWMVFVRAQFDARPDWTLSRRAPEEVLAQVDRWFLHERVAPGDEALREVFPESDLDAIQLRTVDFLGHETRWWVRQIRTARDLYEEGLRFDHCVFSYRDELRDGDSTIWSLTRDGRPCLTIEVSDGEVVQVRGRFNRLAGEEERGVVGQWASRNHLRVSSDAHED